MCLGRGNSMVPDSTGGLNRQRLLRVVSLAPPSLLLAALLATSTTRTPGTIARVPGIAYMPRDARSRNCWQHQTRRNLRQARRAFHVEIDRGWAHEPANDALKPSHHPSRDQRDDDGDPDLSRCAVAGNRKHRGERRGTGPAHCCMPADRSVPCTCSALVVPPVNVPASTAIHTSCPTKNATVPAPSVAPDDTRLHRPRLIRIQPPVAPRFTARRLNAGVRRVAPVRNGKAVRRTRVAQSPDSYVQNTGRFTQCSDSALQTAFVEGNAWFSLFCARQSRWPPAKVRGHPRGYPCSCPTRRGRDARRL